MLISEFIDEFLPDLVEQFLFKFFKDFRVITLSLVAISSMCHTQDLFKFSLLIRCHKLACPNYFAQFCFFIFNIPQNITFMLYAHANCFLYALGRYFDLISIFNKMPE